MFRQEGDARSPHHNRAVAGYLGAIAGYVNSSGFVLVGVFTSHVTGNVGRLADDVALGRASAATLAVAMVVAYFGGAFSASMALESNLLRRRTQIYGALLAVEAMLLAAFAIAAALIDTNNDRLHDLQAILLCVAMGLQNSLVTRLSGAVVRTTHLTGVVTDIGIEAARWFRRWRGALAARTGARLVLGDSTLPEPSRDKIALLLTIVVTFVVGSGVGGVAVTSLGSLALLVPTAALAFASIYAFRSRTAIVPDVPASRG